MSGGSIEPSTDPTHRRILEDPRMHDHKDGFQSCIQCGVCTSGCPAARFTEYSPRETARRAHPRSRGLAMSK